MVNQLEDFYHFQNPVDFWSLTNRTISPKSNEEFLSKGNDLNQKLQEAFVASTFSLSFQKNILPIQIRLARVGERFVDFEIKYRKEILIFEIVMALNTGRRLQAEYRNGQFPSAFFADTFSGKPADLNQMKLVIQKKTQKAQKAQIFQTFDRHLLVYLNLSGQLSDFPCSPESESAFRSIWMVRGEPGMGGIKLLSNSYGFRADEEKWFKVS